MAVGFGYERPPLVRVGPAELAMGRRSLGTPQGAANLPLRDERARKSGVDPIERFG
jgi:hypothetical protein